MAKRKGIEPKNNDEKVQNQIKALQRRVRVLEKIVYTLLPQKSNPIGFRYGDDNQNIM